MKSEIVLRLTPQMIEDIRRRRQQKIEAQKNVIEIQEVGVVDLGEIDFEENA
jgi:hypothetical protein